MRPTTWLFAIAILGAPASAEPETPQKSVVSVFGHVQLLVWTDPQNQGDVPDQTVAPGGSMPKEWNASLHLNASLGGRFTYPKPVAGFIASGEVITAVQIRRIFSVPVAGFTLDNRDIGLKFGFGKFVQPTVSALSPSSFNFSTNWGNLLHATTGGYVAQSLGNVVLQVGGGRPSLPDFTEELSPTPNAAPPLPFAEGRIAYIDRDIIGDVPANPVRGEKPAPLTISVSGAYGQQRVGVGEKPAVAPAAPDAMIEPVVEDLPSWVVSGELLVPLGQFVFAGEAYAGKNANVYTGAVRQRPHIDPMTGRHTSLYSRGAWAQLSWSLPAHVTLLVVGGIERVTKGLDVGVPVDSPLRISENSLVAASLAKNFAFGMHLGVQVQRQSTHYLGLATGRLYAVLAETSIDF